MARAPERLWGSPGLGLLLCLGGCCGLWRYKTNVENYAVFTTRTTIYLEYEGAEFVQWEVSTLCTVANKRPPPNLSKLIIRSKLPTDQGTPTPSGTRLCQNNRYKTCRSPTMLSTLHKKVS
ncbi:hypothetical protein UY3_05307 [Chelonia mydas]|uniref:CATSPERE first N-terminal domain-containing protein n=1 Tax=Chelonia mydas TaxID=8469 RepID=M7BJX0_CHEMY|nr:hypothetical protein UY3_05307 [Chelonia mydas]